MSLIGRWVSFRSLHTRSSLCRLRASPTPSFIISRKRISRVRRETFLAAAQKNGWPLDFFSFHSYSAPSEALRQVRYADRLLDEFGFTRGKTKRVFNEWLPFPSLESLGSAHQASAIAAELIGLQNGPCDIACVYDARCREGIFSPLFNPLTQKPHKAYYAFMAFNELRKRGTAVKACVSSHKDHKEHKDAVKAASFVAESVYAAAARGEDGSVAVMLANPGSKEKPFALEVGGGVISSAAVCRVIDEKHTWKETPLPAALPPRSVLLVEFNPQLGE